MQERLIGRYAVNDVIDPNTNELHLLIMIL